MQAGARGTDRAPAASLRVMRAHGSAAESSLRGRPLKKAPTWYESHHPKQTHDVFGVLPMLLLVASCAAADAMAKPRGGAVR